MSKIYCVGLTGNIASGKSTVATIFKKLEVAVVNADGVSRALTQPGEPAYRDIVNHFGSKIILTSGQLDRVKLREIVFDNASERLWLEHLLHPSIRKKIRQEIETHDHSPYCMIEIPLLKNKHDYPYLDRILVVVADLETQILRLVKRDQCDRKQALAMLATQPRVRERVDLADDILENNGDLMALARHIKKLHRKYLQLAKQKSS